MPTGPAVSALYLPRHLLRRMLLPVLASLLLLGGCTTWRMVRHNRPDVYSEALFPKDTIRSGGAGEDTAFRFAKAPNQPLPPPQVWADEAYLRGETTAEAFLRNNGTRAFLVIRNDSIIYENYFGAFQPGEPLMNFSISKSIVSLLTGIALDSGYFKSLEQPVSAFIPAFGEDERRHIRLKHILNMTSGLNHGDYKHPLKLGGLFYTKNQDAYLRRKTAREVAPGQVFRYKSVDTQTLGTCLERATGRSVAELAQQWLWQPMDMEYAAYWCKDRPGGRAKMYAGLCAQARDLAKIARLYANEGRWQGRQLVSAQWVNESTSIDTSEASWWGNSHSWWLYTANRTPRGEDFYAAGFDGQLIYVHPGRNLIVIRQGLSRKRFLWSYAISRMAAELAPLAPGEAIPRQITPQQAQRYAGVYETGNGQRAEIRYHHGRLWAEVKPLIKELPLHPDNRFSFSNLHERLKTVFRWHPAGQAAADWATPAQAAQQLTIYYKRQAYTFHRVRGSGEDAKAPSGAAKPRSKG